jgi:hypothetical protein
VDEFFVEGIQFAEGWDAAEGASEEGDVSGKGAGGWNKSADQVGKAAIANLDMIQPVA